MVLDAEGLVWIADLRIVATLLLTLAGLILWTEAEAGPGRASQGGTLAGQLPSPRRQSPHRPARPMAIRTPSARRMVRPSAPSTAGGGLAATGGRRAA